MAIISEAASSGISLQADRRVKNRRRRVHMTLELPWSADQCIQQCGRTHRSNQVHGPEYILCMTACGGERRFASTVAKRLQQLGALTKADRRAADASDLSQFDVDTKWGRAAMQIILDMLSNAEHSSQFPPATYLREALGFAANDRLQEKWSTYLDDAEDMVAACGMTSEKDTKSFLNRLLGVPVRLQNLMFSHFACELDEQVKLAKQNDKYDEGVVDIRGESISLASGYPQTLGTDPQSKVPLLHTLVNVDRGISFDRAMELLDDKASTNDGSKLLPDEGFYRSRRALIGREKEDIRGFAILIQKPVPTFALNHVNTFKVYRPATGLGTVTQLSDFTAMGRFQKVDPELANKGWSRVYKDALTFCSHGPNCKDGRRCLVGRRNQEEHIVTGAVLPFWTFLQQVVGYTYNAQDKRVSKMQIVRVRYLDANGKEARAVGIRIATAAQVDKLKQLIQTSTTGDSASAGPGAAASADVKPKVDGTARPDVKPNLTAPGPGASSSSSNMASGPHKQKFSRFTPVTIVGLQAAAAQKYNFGAGKVESFNRDTGRYLVTIVAGIFKGEQLAVREANLMYRP